MGSNAFVAARAKIGEKEHEGVEHDRMKFYKHTYYTSEKGWSSEEAESNYSGYLKGLGYGPKPNTTRATQRRTTVLEDCLKKEKQEAVGAQNELQK
ncbi:hypothetical protein CQW23_25824 [Capsicum baccatum]|uniref:Uncharacterized protein n=1 Tax=Capsicum baccatum TaxID=33114 RepID=A0A2G2VM23_CAPBA|nr:hypothetical protein CQW23_25824 [Capsicum baccatum]